MRNEVELPDYLPGRYKNWLHLYLTVKRELSMRGEDIDKAEVVRLYEGPDFEEREMSSEMIDFYQQFPVSLIKSRALDFILSKLPTFEDLYSFAGPWHSATFMAAGNYADFDTIFNNLLDVCPKKR
jgi:hypothetical protein